MSESEKIKIRVPMIVTADGKWAINGSHEMTEPDWPWIDEMCDSSNPTICPQRYWVEIIVDKPRELATTPTKVEVVE